MHKRLGTTGSAMDQDSLGILSMDNLNVFGDMSDSSLSNINERLKEERQKALQILQEPRPLRCRSPTSSIGTNISELIVNDTIDLNTTGSLDLETTCAPSSRKISARSTLGQHEKEQKNKIISVSDIIKTSFVEKARLLEKKLQYDPKFQTNSTQIGSINCSSSLPSTRDFSKESLNGGAGFSFRSPSEQNYDESFAPAELMESKLVSGEISWAQACTAMPMAALSKQALAKIKAPISTMNIDISKTSLAGDSDLSLGSYFQTRSDNIWNIVPPGRTPVCQHEPQPLIDINLKTPDPRDRTYTKTVETETKEGRNLRRQANIKKRKSSEVLSLTAIDKALRNLDMNSDTSTVEVVNVFHGQQNDENKENKQICDEADIDKWPSTPIKSEGRKVRRRNVMPSMTTTEEDEETPTNKPIANKKLSLPRRTLTLSSTRLDACKRMSSSTESDLGLSLNLENKNSAMSSPRSCLSSPRLDSTTSSDRRMLLAAGSLKTQSSPEPHSGLSSRCSSTSEFSHRDGKRLPLKVTHTSLCWGSTKLRTDMRKSLQIKNTAGKRLVLRMGIQGPGFQLVGNECSIITLQTLECRTITISFCPTVCGAAMGALLFYSPLGGAQPGMEIPLYGYGGNASISIQGLLKGPVGASFLTIGDVCELSSGGPLKASYKFYNRGPLTAFVSISIDATAQLMKLRPSEAFLVYPSQMILPPHTERIVQIEFRSNREDIKNILKKFSSQQVLSLANMRIFCGDEPNRQRMRNLVQRMTKRQCKHLTSSMLDSIWSKFPEEQTIQNLSQLNEPAEFMLDLVTVVRIIDVALTLNRDFDDSAESSLLFLPEGDETVLFRTICQATNSPINTQSHELNQEIDTN